MSAGTNFYCEIFHCESLGLQINDEVGIFRFLVGMSFLCIRFKGHGELNNSEFFLILPIGAYIRDEGGLSTLDRDS